MEEIRVNRLPAITWRYLHVNDSPDKFEFPGNSASAVFSDKRYVLEGGTLPADFCLMSEIDIGIFNNNGGNRIRAGFIIQHEGFTADCAFHPRSLRPDEHGASVKRSAARFGNGFRIDSHMRILSQGFHF